MSLRMQDIERLHLGLLGAAVCVAALTGWLSAPSLLLGGTVMAADVWIMRQLSARLLRPDGRRAGVVVALVVAKFSLFMALLGLLFWRVPLDAPAFGVGATMLLIGLVPRATLAIWAVLAVCFVIGMFGQLLELPDAVQDVSPFQHVPSYPAASFDVVPLVGLTAIAAALTAIGLAALRHRDIG